jgi:hypothetical protein
MPRSKQNCSNYGEVKHLALFETKIHGREIFEKILSLKSLVVVALLTSLTGGSQTNLEKE